MPGCKSCRRLVDGQCTAHLEALEVLGREISPPPIGGCVVEIVATYLEQIHAGTRVLEVGCGTWDRIAKHCAEVGAHYEGIDPAREYFGKPTIATRIENLAELSYDDEEFDVVIGNQTMEHWAEYGCTIPWGLYQCFRVCKTGGVVRLNVPIHFHGTADFLLGRMERIRAYLAPFSNSVTYEPWGKPTAPLPEFIALPKYRTLHDKPAYHLDICARKDRPLPTSGYDNRGAATGRIAQLRNYPLSYTWYYLTRVRLARKRGSGRKIH